MFICYFYKYYDVVLLACCSISVGHNELLLRGSTRVYWNEYLVDFVPNVACEFITSRT